MSLAIVTPSSTRAVSVEEAKQWTGVPVDDDDIRILALIDAATSHIEDFIRGTINQTVYDYRLRGFDNSIYLPNPPLVSVASVKYIDVDGVEQTLATSVYDFDVNKTPGEIRLAYDQS
jgi:hypothetical protein